MFQQFGASDFNCFTSWSEMAHSSECTEQYAQKVFDTADIVRDAM